MTNDPDKPMTVSSRKLRACARTRAATALTSWRKIELLTICGRTRPSLIEFKKSESSNSTTKKATVTQKRDTTTAPTEQNVHC